MSLILLRYGEIGLKGKNRKFFFRKLRRNVRRCLQGHGIEGKVWQEGQRIYLQTDELESAVEAVQRVFGLVSLSPVYEVPANPEAIVQEGVMVAQRAGLDAGRTFRVRARRADKSFPLISPEIERQVGEAIVLATGARPDLSKEAQVEIGVEVQPGRALIFGETIAGPGGLPLGSQGRVVALLSSGIDSPVAAWLMMKRGCGVIPVHFIILSKAAEIAEEMGASALVTGDSLGQVASQTLSNLEVISYGIPKPILRPLIGMDKTEIMDLARKIGTYDASIKSSHACPFLPDRPLTQARMEKLRELLAQMDEMDVHQPKTVDSRRMAADVS
ncbi:MAG: tRNA sulfurtransferase [Anaerolineae bacterium]